MSEEFDKNEQKLIGRLKSLGEEIHPPKESLERLLSSLPEDDVTKNELPRYNFSMWRYTFVAVVVVLVAGFAFLKHRQLSSINPANQSAQVAQNQQVPTQAVTADNADSSLQQTDQAIQSASDQMDQDLKALDQTGSEDDLNNI